MKAELFHQGVTVGVVPLRHIRGQSPGEMTLLGHFRRNTLHDAWVLLDDEGDYIANRTYPEAQGYEGETFSLRVNLAIN